MDEANVVVEAANVEAPVDTGAVSTQVENVSVVNNINQQQPQDIVGEPTQPITETQASDIGVVDTQTTVPMVEPKPLTTQFVDDVSIIEMMSQAVRSNIYSKNALVQAGFDSELATAMAYNESKNRAMAIDEYYILLNKQLKEADLTGWYISPENKEMVTQMNMAKYELSQPNITETRRRQALKTIATVEGYFKEKGISYKGVETLDKIVKEGQLSIQRGRNAAAASANAIKIKAYNLAQMQAIFSSIAMGASKEELYILFGDNVDRQDLKTLHESERLRIGLDKVFEGWVNSLTDKEFNSKTKVVSSLSDGVEIRSFFKEGNEYYIKNSKENKNVWEITTKPPEGLEKDEKNIKDITGKDLEMMQKTGDNKLKEMANFNKELAKKKVANGGGNGFYASVDVMFMPKEEIDKEQKFLRKIITESKTWLDKGMLRSKELQNTEETRNLLGSSAVNSEEVKRTFQHGDKIYSKTTTSVEVALAEHVGNKIQYKKATFFYDPFKDSWIRDDNMRGTGLTSLLSSLDSHLNISLLDPKQNH